MTLKKFIITVIMSIIIATSVTLSNNIINPFKKKTIPNASGFVNPYTNFKPVKKKVTPGKKDPFEKLIPLQTLMPTPGPYDWLAQHKEKGQTYSDFIKQNPVVPDKTHNKIYITLIGDFGKEQGEILKATADFISIYFSMPVKFTPPLTFDNIPNNAKRIHPQTKDKQILSTYIIDKMLKPNVPNDAFCLIAFTASDLWPGENWNFVFGQASMEDRVGVWSIYRNGAPSKSKEDYQLCLLRTLKTGTHEIGHMFSLEHCIYYLCNMNGSNHRMESDNKPLWLCPVCLKKLQWAISFDLSDRYDRLIQFCDQHGLLNEANFYRKSKDLIK